MSEAIKNLETAIQEAIKSRPKIEGFPYLAEKLKQAGVKHNIWNLPSCQSLYVTTKGNVIIPGTSLITTISDVPNFNRDALLSAIQKDKDGKSTFPEFLLAIWKAGITSYNVDFVKRTVTYYGAEQEKYEEQYPRVKV